VTGGVPLHVHWLGRLGYAEAVALQQEQIEARRAGARPDTLFLLEQPPVITLGRGARAGHVLAPAARLAELGIELVGSGRGGDVTYHGPGQLVGYPVVSLRPGERDAHAYLRRLEEGLIATAVHWGIDAVRVAGLTGVWVGDEKLAAIGVRLSTGWITSHGFALNVHDNLAGFAHIVPCGIHDRGVTSLERLTRTAPALADVARVAAGHVARALGRRPRLEGVW